MKLQILILTFGILTNLCGQVNSALDNVLRKQLPASSKTDGRWVYYSQKANIEKINKQLVKDALPSFEIYKVTLTNYLGYQINQGDCIILFDSLKSKIILIQPIWYGGVSEPLIKPFLKKKFDDTVKLVNFLNELHEIMTIGSGYKFVNTSSTDNLITYDLIYFKGDSYTTVGNGTSSTINYKQDGIYRQIEVKIKNLKMVEYTTINPALKDKEEYKDSYKETIK